MGRIQNARTILSHSSLVAIPTTTFMDSSVYDPILNLNGIALLVDLLAPMHSFPDSSEAFHRSSPGSIHIRRPGLGRTLWLEIPDVVSDWLMEANWWSGRQNIQLQKWAEKLDGFEIEDASNVEIFCIAVASCPQWAARVYGQHMAAKSIALNMERHWVLAL